MTEEREIQLEHVVQQSAIDTLEALPSSLFYRSFGAKRASPQDIRSGDENAGYSITGGRKNVKGGEFGTFEGVFLRCVLNILSVVYYLRLGWVVGNCGLLYSIALIVGCGIITSLTALSLSVIVTNGTIKGGGIYYCISRSLGADFGGTIGVVFSFATTFGTVLHTFGFIEVMKDLIGKPITENGKWDTPILGIGLVTVLLIIMCISLAFEFYLQYVLAVLIGISVLGILFAFLFPTGYPWLLSNIKGNLYSNYQPGLSFWKIFAVFFPACTGIMAGANISGDLKDPQKSIPVGTLGAIWFTTILYVISAIILASVADRQTLWNDYSLLAKMCAWKWLVTVGVIAASVSSASAALVGGPKTFQALCKDEILPKVFKFFAVGKKSSDDPVRGFILGYVIVAISCFIFKDLNAVGSVLTNFFLISYSIVCVGGLIGHMSHSPSWRPAWKVYHPLTSILGAGSLIGAMFLINWSFALVTVAITVLLFGYFHWSDTSNNNWGEFPQSILFGDTIGKLEKMSLVPDHVKTYRPQIEYLVNYDLGSVENQITNILPFRHITEESYSLLLVSGVGDSAPNPMESVSGSFVRRWGSIDLSILPRLIGQAGGIGKLFPNILSFSYTPSFRDTVSLFDMVGCAFDSKLGVLISRGFESFDINVTHNWPIDVWWLSDDGGLVLLIGYLLSKHPVWSNCSLRCFTVSARNEGLTDVQMRISRLMNLFRINAEVQVIPGIEDIPTESSQQQWNEFNIETPDENSKRKIQTFLRLREMIKANSASSSIIICSMPIPRATQDPRVWLGLMDYVSEAMPPFIWAHGNNENVVTFVT